MWRWRGWDERQGREGGEGMGGWVGREGEEWEGPEKGVCVLDYMGLALWIGV